MPQTDDLFPDKPPAPTADPATPPAPPSGPPSEDATAALRAALSAALAEHVAPLNKAVADLTRMVQRPAGPQPPAKPDEPPQDSDFLTRFMDGGEGVIEEVAKRTIAKTVLPAVKLGLEQTAQDVIENHRATIDNEFGAGTWKDLFEKDVTEELEGLPLEMQASRRHVLQAVSAIYGRLHMDPAIRAKLEEKRSEVTKAAAPTPVMLTGTGRPRPPANELSQDETTFLASLQRSGFEVDRSSYLNARKLGGSEGAWRAHIEKQRKEAAR